MKCLLFLAELTFVLQYQLPVYFAQTGKFTVSVDFSHVGVVKLKEYFPIR